MFWVPPSLYRECKVDGRISNLPLNFDIHESVNSEVSNKGYKVKGTLTIKVPRAWVVF